MTNKFYDVVGYATPTEVPTGSGIWKDIIAEYPYYGEVTENSRRLEQSEMLNSNITAGNSISIVADEYAIEHFFAIRYIRWAGALWTVTTVKVKSPRLILSLGDVYNGPTPSTP